MKRMHPINIVENISSRFWILLLPLVRGLFASREGLVAWVGGVWFDLLVLGALFGFAFLKWWLTGYELEEDRITVASGIFVRQKFSVPYNRFACVSVTLPFYYRPLRIARLDADSNAGATWKYDFSLTLSLRAAEEVLGRAKRGIGPSDKKRRLYRSGSLYVALLAFISSKTITGVVFAAVFIVQAGRILGNEFEEYFLQTLTGIAKDLAFGIPPAAVFLALIVILGWVVSFLLNLSRSYRFTVARSGNSLQIRSGWLSKFRRQLNVEKVNLIESRQSMVTRFFGVQSLFIHCAGYGKKRNELAVLFPAANRKKTTEIIERIVPEWYFTERTVYPKKGKILRFIWPAALLFLAVILLAYVLAVLFPFFSTLIWSLAGMLELPVLWWLAVRVVSFFHTGVSKHGNVYTLRFSRGYGFHTIAVRQERIVQVTVRQTAWQRFTGTCGVAVYTWSEGKKKHLVPALPLEETCALFGVPQPERIKWSESSAVKTKQSAKEG